MALEEAATSHHRMEGLIMHTQLLDERVAELEAEVEILKALVVRLLEE
jgi:hypothetical protein